MIGPLHKPRGAVRQPSSATAASITTFTARNQRTSINDQAGYPGSQIDSHKLDGHRREERCVVDLSRTPCYCEQTCYCVLLPGGTYISPKTGFDKIVIFTAQVERDNTLGLNISVWRPTGSTYEKLSEFTIMQNLQGSEDMEGFEGYVRISVNVTAPMPVYKGDILGLSLPETDGSTAAPVLVHFDVSENVDLTEEAEGCWNIDEGKLSNCHVLALAAHPVIAVYLADYENGEKWISEIQTDHVYIQNYHMTM